MKLALLLSGFACAFALTFLPRAAAQNTAADYVKIGNAEHAKGKLKEAIAAYDQAIALDPNDATAYGDRGSCKREQEDYKGAEADLDRAIALNPKLPFAYGNRGLVRHMLDDETGAKADADRAVLLAPNDAHAYLFRGMIENTGGNASDALADGNRAIALYSRLPGAFGQRAIANQLMRHWSEAVADWHQSDLLSAESQCHPRLFTWIAQAHLGHQEKANKELATYLAARHPQTNEVRWVAKLGDYLLGHLDEESLLKAATSPDAMTDAGQRCESFYCIGEKKLVNGDEAGAEAAFRNCLATGQKKAVAYAGAKSELATLPP